MIPLLIWRRGPFLSLDSILNIDPGAYGSGAAFGMEDGWILAQALELEHNRYSGNFVRDALQIFQEIRLPYYQRMEAARKGPAC